MRCTVGVEPEPEAGRWLDEVRSKAGVEDGEMDEGGLIEPDEDGSILTDSGPAEVGAES